jgi:pimeloyl-ACP methyl ester carboxylesterase
MGDGPLDFIIVGGQISHVEFNHELPGFTAFVQRLSRFARVVSFDKRGQGLSDRVLGVASLEERMDDVRAVMVAIGSRRAVLCGFSDGSAMSIQFAATYPDRVSHLILVGGYARSGFSISDEAFEASLASCIAAWGNGQSMKHVIGARDDKNEREIALLGKYERLASSPGAFKTLLLMTRRIDVRSILSSVRVSVLIQRRLASQLRGRPTLARPASR